MKKCPFFQNRVIFWKIPNYDRNILARPKCSSAQMIRFRGGDFDLELSMYPCKSCNFWKNAFLSIFTTFEFFWPIFSFQFDSRTILMPRARYDGHFGILCAQKISSKIFKKVWHIGKKNNTKVQITVFFIFMHVVISKSLDRHTKRLLPLFGTFLALKYFLKLQRKKFFSRNTYFASVTPTFLELIYAPTGGALNFWKWIL